MNKLWKTRAIAAERELRRARAKTKEIFEMLNSIEDHIAWWILADQRFRVGQRVEFSRGAHRKNIVPRTTLAKKGVIKRIDSFSILVLIDGRKQPREFHHAFFNPVSGPKLF
jgi:hypothetical protein